MRGFSSVAKAMAAAVCLAGAVGSANAGRQELGYAIEDAAFQTAMKLATDERVDVKRIAFVKLMVGVTDISEASLLGTIFENGLSAVPSDFTFITHQDRDAEWTEVDGFFKAAEDFQDYDPATLPKTGVFAMADSFLVGRLVGATDTEKKSTVQVSLRLIRISTAERIWAGTVEGVYDDPGPGLEMVDSNTRLAIERAVATCAAEVSPKLAGYQALVLPFEGPLGKAMTQVFIGSLSKAESVKILDLPSGSAEDRMFARFLRERMGTNRELGNSVLKKINDRIGGYAGSAKDKVAVMSGAVSVAESAEIPVPTAVGGVEPVVLDMDTGLPVAPMRVEVVFDAKFRDVNDSFAVVAAGSGRGLVNPYVVEGGLKDQFMKWLQSPKHIVLAVVGVIAALVVLWVFSRMFRVR